MCRRAKTLLQGRNRQAQRQLLGLRPARHKLLLLRIPGRSPSLALASTRYATPRGTNFQSANAGRGSLARQASSRSAEIPASGRVQVSRVGVRPGYQRDARLALAERVSDKQRPFASQRNNSKTQSTSSTRPVSTLVRARSNSPRGLGGETPRKSTGPAASHSRIRGERSSKQALGHKPLEWQPHKPAKPDKCSESRGSRYEGGNGRSPTAQPISLR